MSRATLLLLLVRAAAATTSLISTRIVADWSAARLALETGEIKAVCLRGVVPETIFECEWPSEGAVKAGQVVLPWSVSHGLEAEIQVEPSIVAMLQTIWPNDGRVVELAPVLRELVTEFGRCITEANLLEGEETLLSLHCNVQHALADYGQTERLYHRDGVGLRMVTTLQGSGTVVLPDSGVDPEKWASALALFRQDMRLEAAISQGCCDMLDRDGLCVRPHSL
jgi:hypothetical protein|eukprot:6160918-Prymnesium_polylepis.1